MNRREAIAGMVLSLFAPFVPFKQRLFAVDWRIPADRKPGLFPDSESRSTITFLRNAEIVRTIEVEWRDASVNLSHLPNISNTPNA